MFLEMSYRQLFEAGSTLQTRHHMFGNALTPIDWLWCRRCDHSNAAMSIFLRFQCLQTGIGVLEGCVHLVWCESVRCNLCHHEVFRHFEQRLGHGIFLGRGGWKNKCYLRSKLWYWVWEAVRSFPRGYCLTFPTV